MVPANSTQERPPLVDLWMSRNKPTESILQSAWASSTASVEASYEVTSRSVNWMVENRGGMAKLVGLLLVPAQFIGNDYQSSKEIIDGIKRDGLPNGYIEQLNIPVGTEVLNIVICYPAGWKKEDNSRCVVYHNPNGMAMASFFAQGRLSWTPGELFEDKKCPLIMYDYRGVGLNKENYAVSSSLQFRATYESVVQDGHSVLIYAFQKFQQVEIMGSSLGGGVATASLERYLTKMPLNAGRVKQLINHDSFTTSPRVVFPDKHLFADTVGWTIGAKLDAMTPMTKLIERGIKVKIIYHTEDPVIPFGARMGDYVLTLPKKDNVSVFPCESYGHANLTYDMLQWL